MASYSTHAARSRRARRLGAATAAAAALVVLSACGSSSGTSGAATSPGGTSGSTGATAAPSGDLAADAAAVATYPAIAALPGGVAKMKGKTVWFVPVGATVPFLQAIGVGMQAALTQMGASIHICDPKLLPTGMASCMDDAASQGAAAVVAGYIPYSLIPNAFDNLVAKHIPVLVAGEAPDGGKTSTPQLAFYDTIGTQQALQKILADKVISDSKGTAKILFLGSTDSPQLKDALSYARQYYKDHCSGCTFNEIDYLTVDAGKLPSQVSAALISHPDTNYVVQQLDPVAGLVINAIRTAGKSNSVTFVSAGGGLDALQRIKSGQGQVADVGIGGVYTGWQFADGIARMVTGSMPSVVLTPERLFTSANVGSLNLTAAGYASNDWYGSGAYIPTFTKAWGL